MGTVVVRFTTAKGIQETRLSLRGEATLRDLLVRLDGEATGELRAIGQQILKHTYLGIVLLNGTMIRHLEGLDTPVGAGDTVVILPAVAGG